VWRWVGGYRRDEIRGWLVGAAVTGDVSISMVWWL
jgi:hypothetical protein